MDLTSLDIFLAVAEEESVTRAAKRLGRAPSNITTRIQLLEGQMEATLFSRSAKKMSLTSEGKLFLPYAKRLTALAVEARVALKDGSRQPVLRVGTMESTAASRLPPILARFNEAAPTTSLRLTLGASRELTKAVMTGELDCALVARQADRSEGIHATGIDMNAFHSVRVYQEDLLILLPPDHPPVSEPSDIRLPALAALEPGCTYRQIAEQWFRGGAGVPTVELTSYHAILAHVLAGNAAGVMPRSVLEMLPWNRDVTVHRLGIVDTLLISRREARSEPLQAFEQIVLMSSDRPATRQ